MFEFHSASSAFQSILSMQALFPKTLREDPGIQSSPGTRWLLRGGFIEQLASGIWILTPWGLRVRRRIEAVIRAEMEACGGLELELPLLQPRELWELSGRAETYQRAGIAFTLADRKGQGYFLAPTAEEVITRFGARHLRSWRDLPALFWQLGTKFRDELRPRQGLIRGREFFMKDAYSFDASREGMQATFARMGQAYTHVLSTLGFDFVQVEADSGTIGGSGSIEFMALTPTGEDTLLRCGSCGYGGNQEKAKAWFGAAAADTTVMAAVLTPGARSVAEVAEQLGTGTEAIVKTLFLLADGQPVGVLLRGDLELNTVKLERLLGCTELSLADAATVERLTGIQPGFVGPVDLVGKGEIRWLADQSLQSLGSWICGANRENWHLRHVVPGRDLPALASEELAMVDLASAQAGLVCGQCRAGELASCQGVELGHIFQLQQTYSEKLGASFTTAEGKQEPCWMGCYGLGVSRMLQALAEQHHDARGLIWPWAAAPAQITVIPVNAAQHGSAATALAARLKAAGYQVLLENRDARLGEKLTDAELLGFPVQIVLGKAWEAKVELEVRWRDTRKWNEAIFSQPKPDALPQALMDEARLMAWLASLS